MGSVKWDSLLPRADPATDPRTILPAADRQGLQGDDVKHPERRREGPSLHGLNFIGGSFHLEPTDFLDFRFTN